MKERKYLDEFEMSLLKKYGIKTLKFKYDISDLLDMLPKKWKDKNGNTVGFNIWYDCGMNMWYTHVPSEISELNRTHNYHQRGDTMIECLLIAVLELAKDPYGRTLLSKTYVVEPWKYKEDE